MSWEEDFFVAVASVENDKKQQSKSKEKIKHSQSAGAGCMTTTLAVIGTLVLGLLLVIS